MLYSDYINAMGALLQIPVVTSTSATPFNSTDANNILPRMIEYAEGRIYREMDFLAQRATDVTVSCTAGSRTVTLPTTMNVLQHVNAISPASTTAPNGTRNKLRPVSLDVLDFIWPQETSASNSEATPQYIALLNNTTAIIAPTPDAAYVLECVGIGKPVALSSTNTSTYLSLSYPDLLVAASMVFAAGYQRDFGAQSDDPKMALSWSATYDDLKKSAMEEDARRKGQSVGWSNFSAAPLATPQRS